MNERDRGCYRPPVPETLIEGPERVAEPERVPAERPGVSMMGRAPFCMRCGAPMMALRHSMGWGCVPCNVAIAASLPSRLSPMPPSELADFTKWDPERGFRNDLNHTDAPCFVCTTSPEKDGTPHANEARR